MHIGNTFENDIKELDQRKAYKYLGIEENFDIQHKKEKEKLKKEYFCLFICLFIIHSVNPYMVKT